MGPMALFVIKGWLTCKMQQNRRLRLRTPTAGCKSLDGKRGREGEHAPKKIEQGEHRASERDGGRADFVNYATECEEFRGLPYNTFKLAGRGVGW